MKRNQVLLIAGSFLIIIILIFVLRRMFEPASISVQKEEAEFMFGASALVDEFITDEQMANSLYLDKVVQVHGIIDNIADDGSIVVVSIKEPNSISGVLCSFDKSILLDKELKVGEELTVKGICTGYLLDVVLTKCSVVE